MLCLFGFPPNSILVCFCLVIGTGYIIVASGGGGCTIIRDMPAPLPPEKLAPVPLVTPNPAMKLAPTTNTGEVGPSSPFRGSNMLDHPAMESEHDEGGGADAQAPPPHSPRAFDFYTPHTHTEQRSKS